MSNVIRGKIAMIIASISFAMMSVMVKLSGGLPLAQQLFFRNFIMVFFSIFLIRRSHLDYSVEKASRLDLFLRCLFGFLGMLFLFYANNHLNLADVLILQRMNPFFVTIFAAWFLREPIRKSKVIPLIMAFVGVYILVNPTGSFNLFPALVALASSVTAAVSYTLLRKMSGHVEGVKVIFYFSLFSFLVILVPMLMAWQKPTLYQAGLLIMIGVFAAFGQYFLTYAYQNAPASEVSIFDYTGVIASPFLGMIFFAEHLSIRTYLGMILIVGGGILSIYWNKEKVNKETKDHNES